MEFENNIENNNIENDIKKNKKSLQKFYIVSCTF